MFKLIIKSSLYILVVFFLSACSNNQEVLIESFLVPAPPEEPRIKYLNKYKGESDLVEKSGMDNFLGGGSSFAGKDLRKPFGVVAKNGKIYVADTGMAAVLVIDTIQKKVSLVGDKSSGKLSLPVGVALDDNENLYVADSKLQRVFGYDKTGKAFFVLGNNEDFIRPTGIAINRELQIIYVVDTKAHVVRAYSLNGDHLFDVGERGKTDGTFNFPTSIAVDQNSGNIVVVDTQNFRVQIFDQDGTFIHTFGNVGDKPGTFARPKGVAIDSEGNIYVTDVALTIFKSLIKQEKNFYYILVVRDFLWVNLIFQQGYILMKMTRFMWLKTFLLECKCFNT